MAEKENSDSKDARIIYDSFKKHVLGTIDVLGTEDAVFLINGY